MESMEYWLQDDLTKTSLPSPAPPHIQVLYVKQLVWEQKIPLNYMGIELLDNVTLIFLSEVNSMALCICHSICIQHGPQVLPALARLSQILATTGSTTHLHMLSYDDHNACSHPIRWTRSFHLNVIWVLRVRNYQFSGGRNHDLVTWLKW